MNTRDLDKLANRNDAALRRARAELAAFAPAVTHASLINDFVTMQEALESTEPLD